jgi:drug/metabolite transporter (DMT)-like permease
MLGAFIAFASAATFGLNNAMARRGVLTGSVAQLMAISVPLGFVMFLGFLAFGGVWPAVFTFSTQDHMILMVAGVLHFVGSRYCNYRATKAMGGNLVAPVQQLGLLWTLVLAVVVLGEEMTIGKLVGVALLIAGPVVAFEKLWTPRTGRATFTGAEYIDLRRTGNRREPSPGAFVPDYRQGYLFAFLATLGTGTTPILIRYIMTDEATLATGLAAGFVSYAAATVVMAAILALPGQMAHVRQVSLHNGLLFLASGVLVNLSQVFRYMALAIAPVTVVVSIQRTSVVFRLVFAWLLNREHELFTPRVLLASAVSLLGALIVTLA